MDSSNYNQQLAHYRPEYSLLFACARQTNLDFYADYIYEVCQNTIDWHQFLRLAEYHKISPLVYHNLVEHLKVEPDPIVAAKFLRRQRENRLRKKTRTIITRNFVSHCKSLSLEVLLIKGAALDQTLYAQPWFTNSDDVDLVLNKRVNEIRNNVHEELRERFINLHSYLEVNCFEHHDVTMSGVLPVPFDRVWADSKNIQLMDETVRVPTTEDSLIFACINCGRKHFGKLKPLLDIHSLAELPGLDWETLIEKSNVYRASSFVYAALRAANIILNTTIPEIVDSGLTIGARHKRSLSKQLAEMLQNSAKAEFLFSPDNPASGSQLLTYSCYSRSAMIKKLTIFFPSKIKRLRGEIE